MNKLPRGYKVYLPLLLLFGLYVFILPSSPRFNYEYKKGEHWMYETLVAEFDFPILKTDRELQGEKDAVKRNMIPYFAKNHDVVTEVEANLSRVASEENESLLSVIKSSLQEIYKRGVFRNEDVKYYRSSPDGVAYVMYGGSDEISKVLVEEIYTVDSAKEELRSSVYSVFAESSDSLYSNLNLESLIVPDLEYDQRMTDEMHSDSVHEVSPTRNYMSRAEVIVEKGWVITDEIANLLDSYKAEFDRSVGYSGTMFAHWMGISLVALILVVIFFFTLYFCEYKIFGQYNKYLYTLLLYTLFTSATFLLTKADMEIYYMIPYMLMSMFMLAFFRKGFVVIMYFITLLPLLIVAPGSVSLFFIHLMAGLLGIYIFQHLEKGWLQFVGSFISFIVMSAVWMGFCLLEDNVGNWYLLLYLVLSAGLSVAGYPLIYLFERMFLLVSSARLVELSDTSNKLLRMLADKAPGTFHHSLQVMNLADAAARAIGADIPLVRAAALYHDIGKINNPQCFTENEAPGVKVHENLTPRESAVLITRHVQDGMSLAEKHGLPKILRDFIVSHHGTSSASYFLTKYLNEGGDPEDVADFYYDGMKPVTKEHVILMLSDSVEAASRSLKDYSAESISNLVEMIVNGKANDGQLADADISLREITIIKDVMKSFLQQVYHSRIEYPKRNDAVKK